MSFYRHKLETMIKKLITIGLFLFISFVFSQERAYKDGEWLRFRMSYSGFLKAGEAELSVKEETLNGKKIFHATGIGRSSSVISWFFKVKDDYQSYFDATTTFPYLFKRRVNEGGYKIERDLTFNQENKEVHIKDIYRKKEKTVKNSVNVHDMISTFYHLRNHDTKNMKVGDDIEVNMFFDGEMFPFKLKFLGNEILKTKFGKVKTQKFTPLVMAGRVFKAKESVSVWITADDNKIPLKLQADLAVGSLRADLDEYKGLANSFEIIVD